MTAPRSLLGGVVAGVILLAVLILGRSWRGSSASPPRPLATTPHESAAPTPADSSPASASAVAEPEPEASTRVALPAPQELNDRWIRVVERTGGPGIEGLSLDLGLHDYTSDVHYAELLSVEDSPQRVETGPDGLIRLPELPDFEGAVVVRVPDEPLWLLQPRSFAPTAPGRTPETALEITYLEEESEPLLGRVVDAETGEAVAGLGMAVDSWEERRRAPERSRRRGSLQTRRSWVITDEDGCFETARSWPEGILDLCSSLHHSSHVDHVPGAPRQEIPLRVGPLVRLDFAPPPGLETGDFRAILDPHPEAALRTSHVCEPYDPEISDAKAHPFDWWSFPVQGGTKPWVRFQEYAREILLPTQLGVVSTNGLWFGHAPLASFDAHRIEPLRIELESRAAIFGRVTFPDAQPLITEGTGDVSIGLELLTGGEAREPSWRHPDWGLAAEVTHFRLGGLPPGRWRVLFRHEEYLPHEEIVDLASGGTAHLEVVLQRPNRQGVLSGTIHSASGVNLDGKDGRARLENVSASHVDGGEHGYAGGDIEWSEGVGTFRIDEIPEGIYEPVFRWDKGGYSLEPTTTREAKTGEPLRFTARDDVPTVVYEFFVMSDQPTGHVDFEVEWEKGISRHAFGTRLELEDGNGARPLRSIGPLARGGTIRGHLIVEGHVPLWFDDTSFGPIDETGARRFHAVPQPGWGARLVVGDETGAPVSGAVFAFDDTVLLPTDPEGFTTATASAKPRRLRVVSEEWEFVAPPSGAPTRGTLSPDSGTFRTYGGELGVYLRRR